MRDRLPDQPFHLTFIGHICLGGPSLAALFHDLRDRLFTERHPPGRDDDRCPFCTKPQRDRLADPAAAACHNRNFIFEPVHGRPSLFRCVSIVIILFSIDGAEASSLQQYLGLGDHGAIPAEIDGQILD